MAFKPTHGLSRTREYRIWRGMMCRCYDPTNDSYRSYGGRGVSVCPQWHSPERACAYLASLPRKSGQSIDRIDTNGNYEPGNVRFASQELQTRNRRNAVTITYRGRTKTLKQWSKQFGLPYYVLQQRAARNWPTKTLFSPVGKYKGASRGYDRNVILEHGGERHTLAEWARKLNMSYAMLQHRAKRGWPVAKLLTARKGTGHGDASRFKVSKSHVPRQLARSTV